MTQFTPLDLCLLIELVEDKLTLIHDILDDPLADSRLIDEAGDLSIIYSNTAGRLRELYESQWTSDCNYPPYEDLITRNQNCHGR